MDTKDKGITQEICHSYQSLLGVTQISHWESSNKVIIQKKSSNNHLDSQYTDLGSRMQMAVEVIVGGPQKVFTEIESRYEQSNIFI